MIAWNDLANKPTGDILDWVRDQGFDVSLKLRDEDRWQCIVQEYERTMVGPITYFHVSATSRSAHDAVLRTLPATYSAVTSGVDRKPKDDGLG